jgi:hypothetical protein
MISKLVPQKLRCFKIQVKENPKFQALTPLYPESDATVLEVDKVKVKLRQNPVQTTLPTYEKTYTPWTGHTIKGYCKF